MAQEGGIPLRPPKPPGTVAPPVWSSLQPAWRRKGDPGRGGAAQQQESEATEAPPKGGPGRWRVRGRPCRRTVLGPRTWDLHQLPNFAHNVLF